MCPKGRDKQVGRPRGANCGKVAGNVQRICSAAGLGDCLYGHKKIIKRKRKSRRRCWLEIWVEVGFHLSAAGRFQSKVGTKQGGKRKSVIMKGRPPGRRTRHKGVFDYRRWEGQLRRPRSLWTFRVEPTNRIMTASRRFAGCLRLWQTLL